MADPDYEICFSESAAEALISFSSRQQRRALACARRLARTPFRPGDYGVLDSEGREITHLLQEGFVFAYWVDHPVRQILIVEIEAVD